MSHTVIILTKSVLEIFDPDDPEYQGTRDHFSEQDLEEIDRLRGVDDNYEFTMHDKAFVCRVVDRAIFTADN